MAEAPVALGHDVAMLEGSPRIEQRGNILVWHVGGTDVNIHPTRFFQPGKHGRGYERRAMEEAILQSTRLANSGREEVARGNEWDLSGDMAPDPADYDTRTQVTMAIAAALEEIHGNHNVEMDNTNGYKDHYLVITPIHRGDQTLVVRRRTALRSELRPLPIHPRLSAEHTIGQQEVGIGWIPTTKAESLKPKNFQNSRG